MVEEAVVLRNHLCSPFFPCPPAPPPSLAVFLCLWCHASILLIKTFICKMAWFQMLLVENGANPPSNLFIFRWRSTKWTEMENKYITRTRCLEFLLRMLEFSANAFLGLGVCWFCCFLSLCRTSFLPQSCQICLQLKEYLFQFNDSTRALLLLPAHNFSNFLLLPWHLSPIHQGPPSVFDLYQ